MALQQVVFDASVWVSALAYPRSAPDRVEGKADVIVTGDRKHLLPLGSYQGIPIISPVEFLQSL